MWLTRGHTIQYTYIDLKTIKYDVHDIEFFTQLTTENFAANGETHTVSILTDLVTITETS